MNWHRVKARNTKDSEGEDNETKLRPIRPEKTIRNIQGQEAEWSEMTGDFSNKVKQET